jgi:hypothetical protein
LDTDALREKVRADYPQSAILAEFGASAGNLHGPGFDLRWVATNKLERLARVGFIPTPAGILEFSAVSSAASAARAKSDLSTIMLTFRTAGADGKLELRPVPDHT